MGKETSFQSSVLEYLNGLPGCMAENVSGDESQSGRPDINGCYNGRMFKLELKQPDNRYKASLKQNLELRRWYNVGCVVGVVYSMSFLKLLFSQSWTAVDSLEMSESNQCRSWSKIPPVDATRRGKLL